MSDGDSVEIKLENQQKLAGWKREMNTVSDGHIVRWAYSTRADYYDNFVLGMGI